MTKLTVDQVVHSVEIHLRLALKDLALLPGTTEGYSTGLLVETIRTSLRAVELVREEYAHVVGS